MEQSFHIVSALASGIAESGFNLETNYPWYVWGRLGLLSGTICPFLCAKNEFYCFFLLKTFYLFILESTVLIIEETIRSSKGVL